VGVSVDDTTAYGDGEELEEGVRGGERRLRMIAPEGGMGKLVGRVEMLDPTAREAEPGKSDGLAGESTDEGPKGGENVMFVEPWSGETVRV
jgi:hypothetical protein